MKEKEHIVNDETEVRSSQDSFCKWGWAPQKGGKGMARKRELAAVVLALGLLGITAGPAHAGLWEGETTWPDKEVVAGYQL
ncbi:MAG: hypothetical protein ACRDTT_35585, partial [Pseudonocardiaceae bacterium]